jgi:hypothetical protein
MQQVKLKSGNSFFDLKRQRQINIKKVDLKGVHVAGVNNPIPLTFAIRAIKDKVWLQK